MKFIWQYEYFMTFIVVMRVDNSVCMRVYGYACAICIRVCVYPCVYMHMFVYACVCTNKHVCVYACKCAFTCVQKV